MKYQALGVFALLALAALVVTAAPMEKKSSAPEASAQTGDDLTELAAKVSIEDDAQRAWDSAEAELKETWQFINELKVIFY